MFFPPKLYMRIFSKFSYIKELKSPKQLLLCSPSSLLIIALSRRPLLNLIRNASENTGKIKAPLYGVLLTFYGRNALFVII
jgi:hypothetical protein